MSSKKKATIRFSALLGYVNALSAVVPECIVNIDQKGLHSRAVEYANVAMVIAEAKVEKSNLEAKLGIDLSAITGSLKALSKTVPGDALLTLSIRAGKDQDRPFLEIEIPGEYRQYIEIRSLDKRVVRKEPNMPKIALPVRADYEGGILYNAILICSAYSDVARISVDREGICWVAAMGDNSQCKIEIAGGGAGQATSCYSIDYLKDITKALSESRCILNFQNDHPLEIGGALDAEVSARYLVAPRIETEKGSGEMDWL